MPSRLPPIITSQNLEDHMILVEGGIFDMGDKDLEESKPVHKVRLDDFYLLRTPVTQSLWESVMEENPSTFPHPSKPVESVDWHDCQRFIKKLNSRSPYTYRLPTEAEWEYAACGGKYARETKFSGSNFLHEVAWNYGNSHNISQVAFQRRPNALGLFDMSGNVDEWCLDRYGAEYYEDCAQKGIVNNPLYPNWGTTNLVRGGAWNLNHVNLFRPVFRYNNDPGYRDDNLGFRLSRS